MKKALAFDIGGTKIYSTIIDENGNIIEEIEKFSTPKTIDGIKDILKNQTAKYEKDIDHFIEKYRESSSKVEEEEMYDPEDLLDEAL